MLMLLCAAQVPPSILEGPPAGMEYLTDASGYVLTLKCHATGNPTPELVDTSAVLLTYYLEQCVYMALELLEIYGKHFPVYNQA